MPATFGQMLSAARERRGLSIEDAAHETRIPAQRLRLLESGNVAAFGSMTYARSFIRAYSDFLEVDASAMLEELPEGALGGERDYRYLTQSHGPWVSDRSVRLERIAPPPAGRLQSIKSPLPAAIGVFLVILAGTAMWGKHVADLSRQVEAGALKATPVEDEQPAQTATPETSGVILKPMATRPPKIDFPASMPKATPVD